MAKPASGALLSCCGARNVHIHQICNTLKTSTDFSRMDRISACFGTADFFGQTAVGFCSQHFAATCCF